MRRDKRIIFIMSWSNTAEVIDWCNENFGPRHRKRWGRSSLSNSPNLLWPAWPPMKFYINKKEDAMAFKLRWL